MALKELIPWKRNHNELAVRRDPMTPFDHFRREMDQLFDGFLNQWPAPSTSLLDRHLGEFMPTIDVAETEREIRVTAELPGMEQKDVEVALTRGVLTIKGEKREKKEESKGDFYRSECRYGAFERAVPLPAEIDADNAKATFEKGVLKITLPKTAEAQSQRKRIPISA